MARTLSAARTSGFANLAAYLAWQTASLSNVFLAGRHDPHRALLIMVAVALAAAGAAVPHLDNESLSTLLFLAGTGLAATLLKTPPTFRHSKSQSRTQHVIAPAVRSLPKAAHLPARFSELISRQTNPSLDRAAWAKLTAHMSHELRTPLNAVLGFSEMMSNEVFGPLGSSLYASYARDIHASGRLLLKSSEDALAITSLLTASDRKGSCPTTDVGEVVNDAAAFIKPDLEARSIVLAPDVNGALTAIAEPQAVRQMVINLLAAATACAADGATIAVTAGYQNGSIGLSIKVARDQQANLPAASSFPLMLARTLCELSGATLICSDDGEKTCEWAVDFVATAQNDLFV